MQVIKRAALAIAAAGAALAVGTAPALAQSPVTVPAGDSGIAPATALHCEVYLISQGYIVGNGVRNACAAGALPAGIGWYQCVGGLLNLGVRNNHAITACKFAGS